MYGLFYWIIRPFMKFYVRRNSAKVRLIVCTDSKGGIGRQGHIPWLSALNQKDQQVENKDQHAVKFDSHAVKLDRQILHRMTGAANTAVIMGRKTAADMPQGCMPGRTNVILSSRPDRPASRRQSITSKNTVIMGGTDLLTAIFGRLWAGQSVWLFGGAGVYAEGAQYCSQLLVTTLVGDYDCDVFFPMEVLAPFCVEAEIKMVDDGVKDIEGNIPMFREWRPK
jgi:dihydrofolate reductase